MAFQSIRGLAVASCSVAGLLALGTPIAAHAQAATYSFDIPAQDLASAVRAYARVTRQQVAVDSAATAGKRSNALVGTYDAEGGLRALLAPGFGFSRSASGVILVKAERPQATAGASPADEAAQVSELTVTGSRIRGAPSASPTVVISQQDMRNAGQANLGDVVRSLPQNFGGGQNPGIGQGVLGSENVNSSSTLNLRGLGADATLTLLNGRRLAYDGPGQGIDISAIPIAAIARVEVVADGASALYGSDAVAGVANIILKRDYDGVEVSARLAGSTDGGNLQRQASLVGGRTWTGGGFIVALDKSKIDPIKAGQRSYTRALEPTSILTPPQEQFSATLSAHHALSETIELRADLSYSDRTTSRVTPTSATAPFTVNGLHVDSGAESYAISPEVIVQLPADWQSSLSATLATSKTRYDTTIYSNSVAAIHTVGSYENSTRVLELNGDGPVFALPAGDARLALGAGYRKSSLDNRQRLITGVTTRYDEGRDSRYIFGELFLPLVSPEQAIAGVDRLSLTGAVRYEDYPGTGEVATPKLGLIYAPTPSLELKVSWGQSFKAPRLTQQFDANTAGLYPIAAVGGSGPAGATALTRAGGNPDLDPERAETWIATATFRPRFLPGAMIEVSYFNVDYSSRVARPITTISQSLSDPVYAHLLTFNPSQAQVTSTVDSSASFFLSAGAVYNPATVAVIIDNRQSNLARQTVEGVDVSARYRHELASDSSLDASASLTYLNSDQQLLAGRPTLPLSGTIFNPPRYRLRAGLAWTAGDFTASGYMNSYSKVDDRRFTPVGQVDGQTTFDVSVSHRFTSGFAPLDGLRATVAVLNAFDRAPPTIRTTAASFTPYESTNASPAGRVVSLALSRAW